MQSLPYQGSEKFPFHIAFLHRTCKGDLHRIAKADSRTVDPGGVGLPQHHLHMVDTGLHLLGHLENARVGKGSGVGTAPGNAVSQIHGQVLYRRGHQLQGQRMLERNILGDDRLHLLAADVQSLHVLTTCS